MSTSNWNNSTVEADPVIRGVYILLLSGISLSGIFLNIILLVIIRQSELKIRRRSVLITNTTIADLIIVLTFPVDIWYSFEIGNRGYLCVIFLSIKLVPIFVALTSLTLLSVERLYILSKLLTPTPATTYFYQTTGAVVSWIVCTLLLVINGLLAQQLCSFNLVVVYVLIVLFVVEFLLILVSYITSVVIMNGLNTKQRNSEVPFKARAKIAPSVASKSVKSITGTGRISDGHRYVDNANSSLESFTKMSILSTTPGSTRLNPTSADPSFTDPASDNCQGTSSLSQTSGQPGLINRKLDAVTQNIIRRTGLFVVAFFACYGPTFVLAGVVVQIKMPYPALNYSFWFVPLILYVHVTIYPFIALYVDEYWRRRVTAKINKWCCKIFTT
ncbi:hypothetical protein SNE40_004813 [Patella caerulea]|uniref:G-protein coupled receptors family 1 profile domain-containing protein n=1 Tax=Patella caerulea TaxID=87958 RepID=A0AAN8QCV2_PATCE